MEARKSEKGQVLVLIVLGIVVIFGFAALAVDVGRVYAERRRAQNAADASALAAAFAVRNAELNKTTITETELEQIAFKKAQENGFADIAGSVDVAYHHPPISGPYIDDEEYHQVVVTTTVPQSFSQIVFSGTQRLTVEAIARSRPTRSITPGNAMHAASPNACKAVWFDGGGDTTITGGNVFSNSAGTGNCASGQQNGSGAIKVAPPDDILVAGDWVTKGGSGTVIPSPDEKVDHQELPDVPTPDCSGLATRSESTSLQPGIYPSGVDVKKDTTMAPGMYCMYGDFKVTGGTLFGRGVFIVQMKGDIDFTGNGQINLTRANDLKDASGNQWGGMLIYMPSSNHGGIDLAGGGATSYTGTIFAPGTRDSSKPKCTVGGNAGSVGLSANIICDTIQVHGTASVSITYIEEQNFRMPPLVELSQ